MNRNLYIKEKLKMFLLLIYDFKIKNEDGQEKLDIPQSIKSILLDFYYSNALKNYFKKRGDELQKGLAYLKYKNLNSKNLKDNISKKAKNITCFNQIILNGPQIFYTSQNELNIFNEVTCLKLFHRIKNIFIEGYENRKNNLSHRFMLSSNNNYNEIFNLKNQKSLIKKYSMKNNILSLKHKNFQIYYKINNNNLNSSQVIKNIKDKLLKEKTELPYINNVNIKENVILKKNKSHKKLTIFKRKSFRESQKIKDEKIKQQSKENYDYSGIFKLYNFLNNSNNNIL
jgi:hypothetical protein